MPTIIENEDCSGSYEQNGIRLTRLDDEWAFDLYKGAWEGPEVFGRISPFRTSWYHKCLNSNMYLRCDYIKNVNKYFARKGEAARIQYANKTIKEPICVHCYKSMPTRYARMFQLYWLGTQIKHPPLFSGSPTGRNPV